MLAAMLLCGLCSTVPAAPCRADSLVDLSATTTLDGIEARLDTLATLRRHEFRFARRLAIGGALGFVVLGVSTFAIALRSDPLSEYAPPRPEQEQRAVMGLGILTLISGGVSLSGVFWRIGAGLRGTPYDAEVRILKRRRQRLIRERRLRIDTTATTLSFSGSF